MAEYLSQSKYAQLCEITRQAVSVAVKQERIHLTKGRIDPAHPTNRHFQNGCKKWKAGRARGRVTKEDWARYHARKAAAAAGALGPEPGPEAGQDAGDPPILEKTAAGPRSGKGNGSKTKSSNGLTKDVLRQLDFGDIDISDAGIYKNQADVAKTLEQIRALQLKNQTDRSKLINRDLVKQYFSELYTIETTELLNLGERLSPQIAATFGVDDQGAIVEVGRLIQKELSKTLEHIEIKINSYLKSFQVDES